MLLDLALVFVLAQPPKLFLWDYATADLNAAEINRFELKIDDGEYYDVGRMAHADQSQTPTGVTTYEAPIPKLSIGSHTVSMRACNVTECSDPLGLVFIVSIKPAPITNLRIGGGL